MMEAIERGYIEGWHSEGCDTQTRVADILFKYAECMDGASKQLSSC